MMKKTYILTIMLFALAVAGCKKSLNQSINPNAPSIASPQSILSGALLTTVSRTETDYTTFGIWLGYYAPSGNYVPSAATETYTFTNSSFNVFNVLYSNLSNYNYLINKGATDPTLTNFAAISKIMTAYDYQMLVDNYSDVPYSQALNSSKYLFPAYDQGQAIYNDLMVQLDAAIAMINAGGGISPGSSDIVFTGNMANWKKFANTLKLRIAIRQSNITANKAGLITELAKTSAEGYLDDVTFAMAQPGFLPSDANTGQQSTYYKANGYTAAGAETTGHATNRANTFFINFLLQHGTDTVRLKRIYAPILTATESVANPAAIPKDDAAHRLGNIFGNDATNTTNSNTSALGPGIIPGPSVAATIIPGSEACFLLSEAIVDGYITTAPLSGAGSAQDYYQRGITANFVALGATALQAAAYYNQAGVVDVNWAASAAAAPPTTGPAAAAPAGTSLQRAILTQKYICLFGYEILEAYNEYRRTGMPDLLTGITNPLVPGSPAVSARSTTAGALGKGPVPNRILFPVTETQTNAAAVAAEPAVNPFVSTIFWARNVN